MATYKPHHTEPQYRFTADEFAKMQRRRAELLQKKQEVMQRLIEARAMGDLSENGAYKYAKFELGNIRRELRRLHHLLDHGSVIESKDHYDVIEIGCRFTLQGATGEREFVLVNEHESDPSKNKLSDTSPLGQACVGKTVGEAVIFSSPVGDQRYIVMAIN